MTTVKDYANKQSYEAGLAEMARAGWRVQSTDVYEWRMGWLATLGLQGLLGFLLPKPETYRVVYTMPQSRRRMRR